ncbi:hypothetical protein HNQ85_001418 [Anoxybacillus calidus]|uniref:Uncharacterized protein n=1 Tax=[Anoxybacillus] calidus TaxID=575178 RepID=A0A7W0BUT0_9BACL|nr:hypothetical protein [Anoxybacillus calidus]MBA2871148.1 hypothetical protein [Anoxybacillus calidus]
MNANGMIRGYMARYMKVESFVVHVKHQLEEFDRASTFFMDFHLNFEKCLEKRFKLL